MPLLLRRSWRVPLGEKHAFLEDFHAFLHGPIPQEVGHGPTPEEELGSSGWRKACFSAGFSCFRYAKKLSSLTDWCRWAVDTEKSS